VVEWEGSYFNAFNDLTDYMIALFLVGLFCLLLVVGFFTEVGALKFAVGATVCLFALGFVGFICVTVYAVTR